MNRFAPALALTAALWLAAGCEDSMTAQLERDLAAARTPDRTLTVEAPASGAVTPAPGSLTVKDGAATAVSYSPAAGSTFLRWDQTGGSGTAAFANALAAATTVTVTGGNASITPRSTTTPRTLSVQVDSATKGSTSPASTATVGDGLASNVTATANPGWQFLNWTVLSGPAVFGNSNAAATTVTLTGGNASIQANFTAGSYTVTVSGAHGTYSPSGSVTMPGGTATTQVTATPDTDWAFASWAVSPPAALSLSPNTTSPTVAVTAKASGNLTASYTVKKYALTVASGGNGSAAGSVAQLAAGTATSISASPASGYKFNGWTTSTPGTVTFADQTAANTTVVLHGGAGTVIANFAVTVYTLTVDGTYAPGSDAMPSTFTAAAVSGNNLVLLGSVPTVGSPTIPMGLVRSISIASAAGLSSGSATNNYQYIDQWPKALTVDASNHFYAAVNTKVWKGPDTGLGVGGFSYASIDAHDLAWDWTDGKLLVLTEAFPRTVRRATTALVLDSAAAYSLNDSAGQPGLDINRIFAFGAAVPEMVTGDYYDGDFVQTHLGVFAGSPTVQTWLNQSAEDMAAGVYGGWDPMASNPDEITAVSPVDDISQVAVVAGNVDGDYYLWYYDTWPGSVPTLANSGAGKQYLGGTGHAVKANAVYWYGGVPWLTVGGTRDGKATLWMFDGNPTHPYVKDFTIPGYATVLWIYAGAGSDGVTKTEYYAVVKKTLAGTDPLEVVALGFHYQ